MGVDPVDARRWTMTPMSVLPPEARSRSWAEVLQGVAEDGLRAEAERCLLCAHGACAARTMGLPHEDAKGVFTAQQFLHQAKVALSHPEVAPPQVGERVLVIGAGNTAMDAARTVVRLGAKDVRIVYRCTRAESPSRAVEIGHAMEERVSFDYLVLPVALEQDGAGRLRGVRLQRMRLGAPDASGRRRPEAIPDSAFDFPRDTLVQSVGCSVAGQQLEHPEALAKGGWIQDEGDGITTPVPGVFAGGDAVRGPSTVVGAVHDGRLAAQAIAAYLLAAPARQACHGGSADVPAAGEVAAVGTGRGGLSGTRARGKPRAGSPHRGGSGHAGWGARAKPARRGGGKR